MTCERENILSRYYVFCFPNINIPIFLEGMSSTLVSISNMVTSVASVPRKRLGETGHTFPEGATSSKCSQEGWDSF